MNAIGAAHAPPTHSHGQPRRALIRFSPGLRALGTSMGRQGPDTDDDGRLAKLKFDDP